MARGKWGARARRVGGWARRAGGFARRAGGYAKRAAGSKAGQQVLPAAVAAGAGVVASEAQQQLAGKLPGSGPVQLAVAGTALVVLGMKGGQLGTFARAAGYGLLGAAGYQWREKSRSVQVGAEPKADEVLWGATPAELGAGDEFGAGDEDGVEDAVVVG